MGAFVFPLVARFGQAKRRGGAWGFSRIANAAKAAFHAVAEQAVTAGIAICLEFTITCIPRGTVVYAARIEVIAIGAVEAALIRTVTTDGG
jgi:hypothetical protein